MRYRRCAVAAVALVLFAVPAIAKDFVTPTILPDGDVSEVSPDVEFALRADWRVGDRYRLALTKERQEARSGVWIYAVARSIIDVTVLEAGSRGFILTWKTAEYERTDDSFLYSGDVDAAFLVEEMLREHSLEIATNRLGFPVSLRNKQEVIARMRSAMDEALARREADPRVKERLKAGLNRLLDADTVEALVLEDAAAYYGLMGETFRGGAEAVYRSRYLPRFGPPPIDSQLHVLLRGIDQESGLVHIAMRNIADEGQLHDAAVKWFVRNRLQRGHPIPYSVLHGHYSDRQIANYVYDRNRGLAVEVMSEKFSLGLPSFLERRSFHLLPVGSR